MCIASFRGSLSVVLQKESLYRLFYAEEGKGGILLLTVIINDALDVRRGKKVNDKSDFVAAVVRGAARAGACLQNNRRASGRASQVCKSCLLTAPYQRYHGERGRSASRLSKSEPSRQCSFERNHLTPYGFAGYRTSR